MKRINERRRRRPTLEEQEVIRESRSQGIRHVLGVAGLIFLAFVALLACVLVLPQRLELQRLQREREHVELLLQQARDEAQAARDRYRWMMDPEYFEQIARDRVNKAMAGEIVIRSPKKTEQPEQQADAPQRD